jgi:hypothetical protein
MKNDVFGMCSCVALVRTDVLEERVASIIRVKTISELGTKQHYVAIKARCEGMQASVVKRVAWRHIPEDGILQHKIKFYTVCCISSKRSPHTFAYRTKR